MLLLPLLSSRSFWKTLNEGGQKFEPWRHPLNISFHSLEVSVPILSLFVHSEKYDPNSPMSSSVKPYALGLANNSSGCSESTAFDKSVVKTRVPFGKAVTFSSPLLVLLVLSGSCSLSHMGQ